MQHHHLYYKYPRLQNKGTTSAAASSTSIQKAAFISDIKSLLDFQLYTWQWGSSVHKNEQIILPRLQKKLKDWAPTMYRLVYIVTTTKPNMPSLSVNLKRNI